MIFILIDHPRNCSGNPPLNTLIQNSKLTDSIKMKKLHNITISDLNLKELI
jgi:hypothetical protein